MTTSFVVHDGTGHDADTAAGRTPASPASGGPRWNTFVEGGTTTARQFVDAVAPLLLSVARGRSRTEAAWLVEGARAVLATSGREAALSLDRAHLSGATAEVARQAERIGREVSRWAQQSLGTALEDRPAGDFPEVDLRSSCEGHVWTPRVARLLTGERGGPADMQVYNEWLHQMVLLRDALLPFVTWDEVPLRVGPDGLRATEAARTGFLTELLTRRVSHRALVALAAQVVTGDGGVPGYGVLTDRGAAVPAVLGHDVLTSPRWLLRWDPDLRLAPGSAPRTMVHAEEDYPAAPRVAPDSLAGTTGTTGHGPDPLLPSATGTRLVATARPGETTATVALEIDTAPSGPGTASVDLGQAARGHRYAYRPAGADGVDGGGRAGATGGPPRGLTRLEPADVLAAPGLVWSPEGTFAVAAGPDPYVALALLGRLYPENVVLRADESWPAVLAAGKAGPARMVVEVPVPS